MRLVLDTNVVLDCFVFRDRATRALADAIEARSVVTIVHPLTIEELQRVLAYPQCKLDVRMQREVIDRYTAAASTASLPLGFSRDALCLPAGFPRCRDPDDDVFVALAYHVRADRLVSKDRAVLKLHRKVRKFGVTIVPPSELTLD